MKFSKKYWGTVSSGSGDSSNWMPKYIPWLRPGTLNVHMEAVIPEIAWEKEIETHYGKPCRISRCKINGVNAFLINPPEIDMDPSWSLAEVGSNFGLRDVLRLDNGSRVSIQFWIK
jgi:CTP-dependent riboflavin kinase